MSNQMIHKRHQTSHINIKLNLCKNDFTVQLLLLADLIFTDVFVRLDIISWKFFVSLFNLTRLHSYNDSTHKRLQIEICTFRRKNTFFSIFSFTMSSAKENFLKYNTLSCLIGQCVGYVTTVELRNEAFVTGKVMEVDGFMYVLRFSFALKSTS